MRKFTAVMIFMLALLIAADVTAGVRLITDSPQHTARSTSKNNSPSAQKSCQMGGYTKTSCNDGEYPVETCPMSRRYFRYCCPDTHIYKKSECQEMGKRAGSSCHGYYACE